MKWWVVASVFVCLLALVRATNVSSQETLFVSPETGAAGSRFQVVGEVGWTAGETVTIDFAFSDTAQAQTGEIFYNAQSVTVLRDGTWSFPVVINQDLFPFPLWRPGFIIVRASTPSQTATASVTYTVAGRLPVGVPPIGEPPLADLGFGPGHDKGARTTAAVAGMFMLGIGLLSVIAGGVRMAPAYGSRPRSRRKASLLGSRPRNSRTSTSPSTLPPRSRILRR